jgi:single-stranded DNA-binding protein
VDEDVKKGDRLYVEGRVRYSILERDDETTADWTAMGQLPF